MSNTKYVLMFVVLSAAVLTGLTATGMSLGQTAFADDKNQKIDQENKCKIEIENEHGDDNRQNNNDNDLVCQNLAQNADRDASVNGNPFQTSQP
jgi:hypothetical protein